MMIPSAALASFLAIALAATDASKSPACGTCPRPLPPGPIRPCPPCSDPTPVCPACPMKPVCRWDCDRENRCPLLDSPRCPRPLEWAQKPGGCGKPSPCPKPPRRCPKPAHKCSSSSSSSSSCHHHPHQRRCKSSSSSTSSSSSSCSSSSSNSSSSCHKKPCPQNPLCSKQDAIKSALRINHYFTELITLGNLDAALLLTTPTATFGLLVPCETGQCTYVSGLLSQYLGTLYQGANVTDILVSAHYDYDHSVTVKVVEVATYPKSVISVTRWTRTFVPGKCGDCIYELASMQGVNIQCEAPTCP